MEHGFFIYKRDLPHWRVEHSTYFVTWQMAKGLICLNRDEKDIIEESLKFFHDDRYHLWGHVVMNDHVHLVVTPYLGLRLSKLTHTWKSFTANRINKLRNRSGSLWQGESYDRIIRSEEDLLEKLEYVISNPRRRWPGSQQYKWAGVMLEGFIPERMKASQKMETRKSH